MNSHKLEQMVLFPMEFQELQSVQVHRSNGHWEDATIVMPARHKPGFYLCRSLSGEIYGAHWANIRNIER